MTTWAVYLKNKNGTRTLCHAFFKSRREALRVISSATLNVHQYDIEQVRVEPIKKARPQ